MFHRLVAPVTGSEYGVARGVVLREDVPSLHPGRGRDPGQGKGRGCHVDMLDEVVPHGAATDTRSANDERDVRSLVVQKLLAAGVADSVVGHEEDDRVVEQLVLLQAGDQIADLLVGEAAGVEVVGPVLQDHRIAGVVRR